MAILNNSNAISSGGYDINNSLRFRSSATASLSRTPASSGNRKTWTWSGWVKRGTLSVAQDLFEAATNSANTTIFYIDGNNNIALQGGSFNLVTTQVFRDPSAWYHIVLAVDTTQATAANRAKMYVNGSQITAFTSSTYETQNTDTFVNNTITHAIGRRPFDTTLPFDGYMTDINFIDGQALTPSSFGETDTTTGSWKPKAYTGTYGTNGFYLKFSDIATTSGSNAGLGKDFSGNANYWTTNNISVTAGTTYDAMIDSPTLTSATVANYAVLDPLDPTTSGNMTLSNANLTMTTSAANRSRLSTIYVPSGKWYAEVTFTTASGSLSGCMVGLCRSEDATSVVASYLGSSTNSYGYNQGGDKYNAGSATAYGASYTNNDVIGIAFDADAGTVTFYKNNTSQGTAFTGLSTSSLWSIGVSSGISSASANIVSNINFGQRPFSYTPPTGFVALNTFNLPTPTILQGNKYMDATLYTGNGTSQTITNAGAFKPDFVWVKSRSVGGNPVLVDSVRGANKVLYSPQTTAEETPTVGTAILSFNSNGFSLGGDISGTSWGSTNGNTFTYVGWQWQAGQGSTSSNTSGSITSTVSVNTTAGFSVVTYTGNNTLSTVGHGLGVGPKFIIVKTRSGTDGWIVYHASLGVQYYSFLNTTAASLNNLSNYWGSTAPSSTTFSINAYGGVNTNGATYVAYCWAEIAGFSRFGSYTGNGSANGPMIYLGFQPKFVMFKDTTSAAPWYMWDASRNTSNSITRILNANNSNAEGVGSSGEYLDFLSNGFKLRSDAPALNNSGDNYIYMAFSSNPFKNSNAF